MPDFQRDITLTGGTNDFFVAPASDTYWFYNPPTNASVTFSKAGKAPQIISAGEVFVVTLARGEEVALSGTANQILSVYDHADVKLIPAAKDILGNVQIAAVFDSQTSTYKQLSVINRGPSIPALIVGGQDEEGFAAGNGELGTLPAISTASATRGLTEGNMAHLSVDLNGVLRISGTVSLSSGTVVGINSIKAARGGGTSNAGSVSAPGAGATITSLSVAAGSTYEIQVSTGLNLGSPVTADFKNFGLFDGATQFCTLMALPNGTTTRIVQRTFINTTLLLKSPAAATAGVTYVGELVIHLLN